MSNALVIINYLTACDFSWQMNWYLWCKYPRQVSKKETIRKMSINIDIKLKRASKIYHEGVSFLIYYVITSLLYSRLKLRLCCRR